MSDIKVKTARELILKKFPTAFAHDNGRQVTIRVGEQEVGTCPECKQDWTRPKTPTACRALGGSGNEKAAWESVARNLDLM